jgi:hypothetical protein
MLKSSTINPTSPQPPPNLNLWTPGSLLLWWSKPKLRPHG